MKKGLAPKRRLKLVNREIYGRHVFFVVAAFINIAMTRRMRYLAGGVKDDKRATPTYESEMERTRSDGVLSSLSRGEECADKQGAGDMSQECFLYAEGMP
jgi:hypothetical protein